MIKCRICKSEFSEDFDGIVEKLCPRCENLYVDSMLEAKEYATT